MRSGKEPERALAAVGGPVRFGPHPLSRSVVIRMPCHGRQRAIPVVPFGAPSFPVEPGLVSLQRVHRLSSRPPSSAKAPQAGKGSVKAVDQAEVLFPAHLHFVIPAVLQPESIHFPAFKVRMNPVVNSIEAGPAAAQPCDGVRT